MILKEVIYLLGSSLGCARGSPSILMLAHLIGHGSTSPHDFQNGCSLQVIYIQYANHRLTMLIDGFD